MGRLVLSSWLILLSLIALARGVQGEPSAAGRASSSPSSSPSPSPRSAGSSPCVLWRGTVGGQPVAVRLERDGLGGTAQAWVGEYGSPHMGTVTHLFAHRQGESWVVDEGRAGATWSLESRGDDRVGTWRSADGHRTAQVLLSCLAHEDGKAIDAPVALLLGRGAPTHQLARLLRRGLTVETDVAVGSARYRNAVDVMLGRAYLQLTVLDPQRPARPALLREINERIRQHFAKAVQEETTGREQFSDCEIESSVEIKFASPRFLTLSTFDEWSCGNPHSEQNTTLETFDVSGERAVEVALAEAYQTTGDTRTKRAFWRVVSAARGPAVGAAKCVEDEALAAHYELGIVQGGILVDVDFGTYAADPCDFSVVLSERALRRFASPLHAARHRVSRHERPLTTRH